MKKKVLLRMDLFFKNLALAFLFVFGQSYCGSFTYKIGLISKEPTMPIFIKEIFEKVEDQPLDLIQRVTNNRQAYQILCDGEDGLKKNPSSYTFLKSKHKTATVLAVSTVDQVWRWISFLHEQYPMQKPFYTIYLRTKDVSCFLQSYSVFRSKIRSCFFYIVPVDNDYKNAIDRMRASFKKELEKNEKNIFFRIRLHYILSYFSIEKKAYLPDIATQIIAYIQE